MCRDQIRIVDHVEGSMEMAHLPKRALPDHLDRLKVVDAKSTSFQSGNQGIIQVSQNSGKSAIPLKEHPRPTNNSIMNNWFEVHHKQERTK